jgi:hypothetical protein
MFSSAFHPSCNPAKVSHVLSGKQPSSIHLEGTMKTALHLLAVTTVLIAPTLSAPSVIEPQASTVRDDIEKSDGELSPGVQLYVSRGDEQSNRLHFNAAAREYRLAADVARREGHLPSWPSWKVATA